MIKVMVNCARFKGMGGSSGGENISPNALTVGGKDSALSFSRKFGKCFLWPKDP